MTDAKRLRDYRVMGARLAYTAEAAFYEGLKCDGFIDSGEWARLLAGAADARESLRGQPADLTVSTVPQPDGRYRITIAADDDARPAVSCVHCQLAGDMTPGTGTHDRDGWSVCVAHVEVPLTAEQKDRIRCMSGACYRMRLDEPSSAFGGGPLTSKDVL